MENFGFENHTSGRRGIKLGELGKKDSATSVMFSYKNKKTRKEQK